MERRLKDEPGKVFVGGLSWNTNQEMIHNYFSTFGEVIDSVVMKNPQTGKSRGFGFVTFANPAVSEIVLNDPGHMIDGRKVDCKACNARTVGGASGDKKIQSVNRGQRGAGVSKIFMGGIPGDADEDTLKDIFLGYGPIAEIHIMYDQDKKRSRGFGFLTFESEDSVDKVCAEHYIEIQGKKVECKRAQKNQQPGPQEPGMGHGPRGPPPLMHGHGGGRGGRMGGRGGHHGPPGHHRGPPPGHHGGPPPGHHGGPPPGHHGGPPHGHHGGPPPGHGGPHGHGGPPNHGGPPGHGGPPPGHGGPPPGHGGPPPGHGGPPPGHGGPPGHDGPPGHYQPHAPGGWESQSSQGWNGGPPPQGNGFQAPAPQQAPPASYTQPAYGQPGYGQPPPAGYEQPPPAQAGYGTPPQAGYQSPPVAAPVAGAPPAYNQWGQPTAQPAVSPGYAGYGQAPTTAATGYGAQPATPTAVPPPASYAPYGQPPAATPAPTYSGYPPPAADPYAQGYGTVPAVAPAVPATDPNAVAYSYELGQYPQETSNYGPNRSSAATAGYSQQLYSPPTQAAYADPAGYGAAGAPPAQPAYGGQEGAPGYGGYSQRSPPAASSAQSYHPYRR